MALRDKLNENPRIAIGIAILGVLLLGYLFWPASEQHGGAGGSKVFFTIDDGKNYFPDEDKLVPPFDKDGKQAVRAYVWKCDDGKVFVGYLMRYTPEYKKKLEEVYASAGRKSDAALQQEIQFNGIEVKAPGGAKWIKQSDPAAGAIITPKCGSGMPQPVNPT